MKQSIHPLLVSGFLVVVAGCGGSTEEGTNDDQSAQSGNEPPAMMPGDSDQGSNDGDGTDDSGGSEPGDPGNPDPADDDQPGTSDPGDDGMGTDEPGTVDPTDVTVPPDPNDPMDPGMGTEPGDPGTPEPEPESEVPEPEPNAGPCDGLECGAVCDPTNGLTLLLAAPLPPQAGYCNATGECTYDVPACGEETDCTANCPVIEICMLCDDGETCADPHVACNADGTCGETTWECEETVEPVGCDCPIGDACMVCDDGTCAGATPVCNPDGTCGGTEFNCPGDEPKPDQCASDADCPATRIACSLCDDGTAACPAYGCVNGQCELQIPACEGEYDPCADKADGDYCSLCPPNDPACSETADIKTCQNGECRSQVNFE